MPSDSDDPEPDAPSDPDAVDDTPTIACERCGRAWDLDYELDEMAVGNLAVEQFALDHQRHTGHFPDGISTWQAECRNCPEEVQRLEESAARRWAETHARHTRHTVAVTHADGETTLVDGPA
ncbi:hypothetical protein [Halapricum salinum]|uniref:Uncharacterized protein n=1 Tax=Halapricum salinum TaxID=1457250 RepID=A0A4D6HE29_9EURY|nr:hypothetical protein [Halapricum salinum]QCC51801.1 hypothetical protein DV733_11390 [Halapricum salinum]